MKQNVIRFLSFIINALGGESIPLPERDETPEFKQLRSRVSVILEYLETQPPSIIKGALDRVESTEVYLGQDFWQFANRKGSEEVQKDLDELQ